MLLMLLRKSLGALRVDGICWFGCCNVIAVVVTVVVIAVATAPVVL